MLRTLLVALLLTLAVPAIAVAGGWTTVALESPPASDVRAGGVWNADLTVLQHGRTPLAGQKPIVTITSGGRTATFTATPSGEPGAYRARVVFPAAGSWKVSVDHGWGVQHDFGPFAVGARDAVDAGAVAGPEDGGWIPIVAAVLAALVAAGLAAGVARHRRRRAPAPPHELDVPVT